MTYDLLFGMPADVAAIVIPTIASIVVFIAGYLLNYIIEYIKKANRKKEIVRIVKAWIDIILAPLESNIQSLERLARDSQNNTCLQQPGINWSPLMGEKLERAIDNDFLNLILSRGLTQKSRDKYRGLAYNLISQTHFLTEVESEIRKKYDEYTEKSVTLIEKWNNIHYKIHCETQLLLKNKLDITHHRYGKLYQITENHSSVCKQNPNNFNASYSSLITPLQENFNLDSEFNDLKGILPRAEELYLQWTEYNKGYYKVFKGFSQSLEDVKSILEEVKDNL